MTTAAGSIAPEVDQDTCPSIVRSLFNYLALDWRARSNPGEISVKPRLVGRSSEVVEYFAGADRIALAQRKVGSNRMWDPKNVWLDGAHWRAYQDYEGHRCTVCVLAKNRAEPC